MKNEDITKILDYDGDFFFVLKERCLFRRIKSSCIRSVGFNKRDNGINVVLELDKSADAGFTNKASVPLGQVFVDPEEAVKVFQELVLEEYGCT